MPGVKGFVALLVIALLGCVKPNTAPNVELIEKEQWVEDRYVATQPKDWAKSCEEVAANRVANAPEDTSPADREAIRKAALEECRIERSE